jgi:hypothetical protein
VVELIDPPRGACCSSFHGHRPVVEGAAVAPLAMGLDFVGVSLYFGEHTEHRATALGIGSTADGGIATAITCDEGDWQSDR